MNTNELNKGIFIIIDRQPYEIIEISRLFKGRGHSVAQTKLKNLITGSIISKSFHPSDDPEQCEIEKANGKFIYAHRGKFIFSKEQNPSDRFQLSEDQLGKNALFLKPNQTIEAIIFQNKIIKISMPIKISFKVEEAPPGDKGNRSQPGNKIITLETGAKINAPLFIKQGDIVEVNTETGEYVRRL